MPAEVITMMDCASNYGVFVVKSHSAKNKNYMVSFGGSEGPAHCTCKAFEYSPEPKSCKHITEVFNGSCRYNPQWCKGTEDPTHVPTGYTYDAFAGPEHKCPACGGPMVFVRRAV